MRKSSLVLCSLALATILTACGQSRNYARLQNSMMKNGTVTVSENDIVAEETEEPQTEEQVDNTVIFTKEKQDSIKRHLDSFSTIYATQSFSMGVDGQDLDSESSLVIYADTANSIFNLNTSYIFREEDAKLEESVAYRYNMISDVTNSINIIQQEDGTWLEADGTYSVMDWDFSIFNTPYDVYDYLIGECKLDIGTEGTRSDNYEYYTVDSKAASYMLTGVDYDTLKSMQLNYIFENKLGTLVPKSCTVEIIYTKSDVDYFIRATIQISSLDNAEIILPEYTRTGEVRKSTKSADEAIKTESEVE